MFINVGTQKHATGHLINLKAYLGRNEVVWGSFGCY